MLEETKNWLSYSEENLAAAKVLFESMLYNTCLHNVQQSVEKVLKSLFIEKSIQFKKTHSIMGLKTLLEKENVIIDLTEDDCDFLDSIYLPSKYPIGSALPSFAPDEEICLNSIALAEGLLDEVRMLLSQSKY